MVIISVGITIGITSSYIYIHNYIVNNYVVSGDYNYSIVELDELLDFW